MNKIKLSELLEFGRQDYNSLKLDNKIKEKILEKTIYRKSIFSSIFKYTTVFTSFIIFVIFWVIFYQNMRYFENTSWTLSVSKNNVSLLKIKEENNRNISVSEDRIMNNIPKSVEKDNMWYKSKKMINNNSLDSLSDSAWWWRWFTVQSSSTLGVIWSVSEEGWNKEMQKNIIILLGFILITIILIYLWIKLFKSKKKK